MGSKTFERIIYPLVFKSRRTSFAWLSVVYVLPVLYNVIGISHFHSGHPVNTANVHFKDEICDIIWSKRITSQKVAWIIKSQSLLQSKIAIPTRVHWRRTTDDWASAHWNGEHIEMLMVHFILQTYEGSHPGKSNGNSNPLMTLSAGPVPRVVQTIGSVHAPPAGYTAQLLTLHQHRANNQERMAYQI